MGAQAVGGFVTIAVVLLFERWLSPPLSTADAEGMNVRPKRGEAARIRARHSDRLDEVRVPTPMAEEFDVPSFDAVLRLADEHGARISFVSDPALGRDLFFVDNGGIRYRYRAAPRPGAVGWAVTV